MPKRVFKPHPIWDTRALKDFLRERNLKPIHAQRIYRHLVRVLVDGGYEDGDEAAVWEGIEALPRELYTSLPRHFTLMSSKVVKTTGTNKGDTTKLVVELQDGLQVESVIMIYDPSKGRDASKENGMRSGRPRATLCLSSQVGCAMACKFCATGTMGLKGNLNAAEIVEQLIHATRVTRIRNVVFMGMGEPLNNYQSVVDAVRAMIDPQLFSLSPSHITVSTVGVTNRIRSLAVDLPEVNLALSLHAPNQEIRLAIVPTGKAYPVQKLIRACRYWQEQTGRRIFFEYVVLGGVNDQSCHAEELGELLRSNDIIGVVNLIPWNPIEGGEMYKPPDQGDLSNFQKILREGFGISCTFRREFGQDINSACGQLVINSNKSAAAGAPKCGDGGTTVAAASCGGSKRNKVGLGLLLDW